MTFELKRIGDPFQWIDSTTHADSTEFRKRQQKRAREAEMIRKAAAEQAAREAATTNVQPINKRKARA